MRIACFVLIAAVSGSGAAAQAPSTAEACKALPNGGKTRISVPGATTPPGCQACAPGVNIPANFVLGFSDGSRGTCELKNPQGGNSGLCRADTTCPPGTTRVSANGVWSCQAPSTTLEVDCPRVPTPPASTSSLPRATAGPDVRACESQMRSNLDRLKREEQKLRESLGEDAARRGTGATTAMTSYGEALRLYGVMYAHLLSEAIPHSATLDVACNNPGVDLKESRAVAECDRARAQWKATVTRGDAIEAEFVAALKTGHAGVETAGSLGEPNSRAARQAALKAAQDAFAEAARQLDACLGKFPRPGR